MSAPPAPAGVLVVDKPAGPTSHDVVAVARRALACRKVGHLGTLDPPATGVLPLVVGRATRLAPLFSGAGKQYDAVIRLGLETDTDDIGGAVVGGRDAADPGAPGPPPPPGAVEEAAARFVGSQLQRPPAVSAKKLGGVRAYDLARRGRPAAPAPVRVAVDTLEVLSIDGPRVRCRIACSAGFYVRALARDLGESLGCGGCLETLRRERHGRFTLADAVPLDRLVEEGAGTAARLIPIDDLLPELPGVVLTDRGARRAAHGNPIAPPDVLPNRGARRAAHGNPIAPPNVLTDRGARRAAHSNPIAPPDIAPAADPPGSRRPSGQRCPSPAPDIAPDAGPPGGATPPPAAGRGLPEGRDGGAADGPGGGAPPAGHGGPGGRVRLLDADGRLLAIADPAAGGVLHPRIVLV